MVSLPVAEPRPSSRHINQRRLRLEPSSVLRTHARTSFSLATRFLPPEKRRATTILYAFFRSLDDIVDSDGVNTNVERKLDYLADWHSWALSPQRGGLRPGLAVVVDEIFERYEIPRTLLTEFIAGLESDVTLRQIETRAEFDTYCYRVASTVGIAMTHVLGARSDNALKAAKALGAAMQMTNVLRDVGEDLEIDRVYIPRTTLETFGLDRHQLRQLRGDHATASQRLEPMMRWLIEENRRQYRNALPGIFLLPPDTRLPILLASRLYRHLLSEIENNGYDSINFRASTSRLDKVRELAVSKAITTLWHIDENGRLCGS